MGNGESESHLTMSYQCDECYLHKEAISELVSVEL